MARYLLVDDRDGSVLTELASARQAARLLARAEGPLDGDVPISVVRVDHHQGSLTEVRSLVAMRPLPPLMVRRGMTKTSADRPIDRRSAPTLRVPPHSRSEAPRRA